MPPPILAFIGDSPVKSQRSVSQGRPTVLTRCCYAPIILLKDRSIISETPIELMLGIEVY